MTFIDRGHSSPIQNNDNFASPFLLHIAQAAVLQAFDNNTASLSFSTLQQLTGITDLEVLKRLLHSLSCQKFKVRSSPHLYLNVVINKMTPTARRSWFRYPLLKFQLYCLEGSIEEPSRKICVYFRQLLC